MIRRVTGMNAVMIVPWVEHAISPVMTGNKIMEPTPLMKAK